MRKTARRLVVGLALVLYAVAILVLFPPSCAQASTWVFESASGPFPAVGFLEVGSDPGNNHGALFIEGYRFPLTGYGHLVHGWWTDVAEWFCCVVIDSRFPWVFGVMLWKDGEGVLDLFTMNGVLGEWTLKVSLREDLR